MKGRLGPLLTDTTYWMAVCNFHHRHIEDNRAESYERGYLIKRL